MIINKTVNLQYLKAIVITVIAFTIGYNVNKFLHPPNQQSVSNISNIGEIRKDTVYVQVEQILHDTIVRFYQAPFIRVVPYASFIPVEYSASFVPDSLNLIVQVKQGRKALRVLTEEGVYFYPAVRVFTLQATQGSPVLKTRRFSADLTLLAGVEYTGIYKPYLSARLRIGCIFIGVSVCENVRFQGGLILNFTLF